MQQFNNGMNMGMGMQDIPPTSELWKNEKDKYRIWIILLGIGLITILTMLIIAFALGIANKGTIIDSLLNKLKADYKPEKAKELANSYFIQEFIVLQVIKIVAVTAGLVLYVSGTINAYHSKNFAKLSGWPTFLVGFGALLAVWSIIRSFWGGGLSTFDSSSQIYNFIANILFVIIYVAGSSQVSKIRRLFLYSERMQAMKNNPQMQQMQQQFMNMMRGQGGAANQGPFGPQMNPGGAAGMSGAAANNNQQQNNASNPNETVKPVEETQADRLKKLTIPKLKEIAKKLSISGYTSMKKDELISAILRVTDNK